MFWFGFDKTLSSFVRNFVVEARQCLGVLALNNLQKVRHLELERYVFVDVFERFILIALLINVMFLKSLTNSFQLLLAMKTGIHGVL
jgi:hypothetical protein